MRIFLIENYVTREFDIHSTEGIEQVIEFAKKNCSRAINEFIKTNNELHRGLNGVDSSHAYVVPTLDRRESLGNITRGKTGASFNNWLKRNGHVQRLNNVAFTTSSSPHTYNGVSVDAWFYFLPIGDDYHYTYIDSKDATDYNHTGMVQRGLGQVRSVEESIDALEIAANLMNHKITKLERRFAKTINTMSHFQKIVAQIRATNKMIYEFVLEGAMLFQKGIFNGSNLIELDTLCDKYASVMFDDYDIITSKIRESLSMVDISTGEHNIIESIYDDVNEMWYELETLSLVSGFVKNVDELMKSFITDHIGDNFKNKEVMVGCKSYLMIPYSDGEDIIKSLL